MATQDQMTDDDKAYAAAFDEDMAVTPGAAEDDSFGISPAEEVASNEDAPSTSDGATEGEPAAVALVVADGEAVEQAEGEANADATTTTAEEEEEGPTDPKEIQRQKSWEGRLRAREEELARREAALKSKDMPRAEEPETQASEGLEEAADQLSKQGDAEGAEAVENVAEKVESGELTAEQAMKILAEDFGPEFVKMIEAIASSKAQDAASRVASEATSTLSQSVQEIIDDITDSKARAHFEAIASKHPDFNDVAQTPEFAEFVKTYENGEQIAQAGSAKDIVKMLDAFKAGKEPAAPEQEDPAVAAAEGVRSSGLRLPEAPTKAEGFEEAWSQF